MNGEKEREERRDKESTWESRKRRAIIQEAKRGEETRNPMSKMAEHRQGSKDGEKEAQSLCWRFQVRSMSEKGWEEPR